MPGKDALSGHLLLLTLLALLAGACGGDESAPEGGITPRSVGAVSLASLDEFPSSHRTAAEAVIASVEADGDDPGEFFATVDRQAGVLVFHLWHESAFLPENLNMVGNPGGLCRDVHVDIASTEVVATLWWQ